MKKQKNIKKLVGRIGDNYYVCDYVFKNGEAFRGAVATVLRPISKQEHEDAQDINNLKDYFADLWAEAAKNRQTTESLEDFVQGTYDNCGDECLWDFSGYEYWDMLREAVPELTEEDYPVFDCAGGGRSFDVDMKWDAIYDAKAWALIKEYETVI